MGLFDMKEKKLRNELGKKNVRFCREAVKELEELHDDLKSAYEGLENLVEEFRQFAETAGEGNRQKIDDFSDKLQKFDKLARNAVRDVRDVLRNQRKRLKEASGDLS
jgi:archaellum component FlaC